MCVYTNGENMKTNKEMLYETMQKAENSEAGFTTQQLSDLLGWQRANVSAYLNQLVSEGKCIKGDKRPVRYFLAQVKQADPFYQLVGVNGSLRNAIGMAKAALLYPNKPMSVLLVGQGGSGISYFAAAMIRFGQQHQIFPTEINIHRFNARSYRDDPKEGQRVLFGQTKNPGLLESSPYLFINHVQDVKAPLRDQLSEWLEGDGPPVILGCDDPLAIDALETLTRKVEVRIDLPELAHYTYRERYDLISRFFAIEAQRAKRDIVIDAQLLICLLLYRCQYNIKQLRNDIRLGCASGYLRDFAKNQTKLVLHLGDFPHDVRNGLLQFQTVRHQIESLVPLQGSVTFGSDGQQIQEIKEPTHHLDFYDRLSRRVEEFQMQGHSKEESSALLLGELNAFIASYTDQANQAFRRIDTLAKFVSPRVVELVKNFLQNHQDEIEQQFATGNLAGLCLHIQGCLEQPQKQSLLSSQQIETVLSQHPKQALLAKELVREIETKLLLTLNEEETAYLTLFLAGNRQDNKAPAVSLVIALHGEKAASSVAEVVKELTGNQQVYGFDLPLAEEIQRSYQRFESLLNDLPGGAVTVIYDMGSIETMCSMASAATHRTIQTFPMPLTMAAIEISRKYLLGQDPYQVLPQVQDSLRQMLVQQKPTDKPKAILTLCYSGQGGAVQIAEYLGRQGLENVEVLPLSMLDKKQLQFQVEVLRSQYQILAVISAFDPGLGIFWLSLDDLLRGKGDVSVLKHLKPAKPPKEVYEYFAEQMPAVDSRKLKRALPKAMQSLDAIQPLDQQQTAGLLVHLTALVNRILSEAPILRFPRTQEILQHYPREVTQVIQALKPLERTFNIVINEEEIATIVSIIKRI